jgi:hypothetical protein
MIDLSGLPPSVQLYVQDHSSGDPDRIYAVTASCGNCDWHGLLIVDQGTRVPTLTNRNTDLDECLHCRVKGLLAHVRH